MIATCEVADECAMTREDTRDATGPAAMFRWECPLCGKAGMVEADDQRAAKAPLIRHLRYTEGDGHDAHDAVPDGMSIHALDDYIDRAV